MNIYNVWTRCADYFSATNIEYVVRAESEAAAVEAVVLTREKRGQEPIEVEEWGTVKVEWDSVGVYEI